jgi:geranylgeranyl pyrophosphate synthase
MTAAQAPLGAVLSAGGPSLAAALARTEERLAEVAAGHGAELEEHAAAMLTAGGKRLRPVLVFLAAAEDSDPRLVSAAVAVELLHMATLVHDDVLDRAPLRRGNPTVFASGGREAATATGDLLFSRAFAELAATGSGSEDAVSHLSAASTALARGELMQRADAWLADVRAERYLERCRLKTASLFDACCRLGALFGGAPGHAPELGAFGEDIGLAFQLLDDVLDVSGPVERTGKPRGADLLDGTVTLPLILARAEDAELRALDLRSITGSARAEEVCDRIAATGALAEARARALEHVASAKERLGRLSMAPARAHALRLVADGVVERYA